MKHMLPVAALALLVGCAGTPLEITVTDAPNKKSTENKEIVYDNSAPLEITVVYAPGKKSTENKEIVCDNSAPLEITVTDAPVYRIDAPDKLFMENRVIKFHDAEYKDVVVGETKNGRIRLSLTEKEARRLPHYIDVDDGYFYGSTPGLKLADLESLPDVYLLDVDADAEIKAYYVITHFNKSGIFSAGGRKGRKVRQGWNFACGDEVLSQEQIKNSGNYRWVCDDQ